jgi:predicted nucleic acid-binding protein
VRLVVDAGVVMAWLLAEEHGRAQAIGLRTDVESGLLDPVVPAAFGHELRRGLVRAARRGKLGWERVSVALAELSSYRWPAAPPPPDRELLDLCRRFGLGWTDAQGVHLAAMLGIPLVTADHALARLVPPEVAWVEWLGDRPPA